MTTMVEVTILDVATGNEHTHKAPFKGTEEQVYWNWTGGNYGCDCNRSSFIGQEVKGCNMGDNKFRITAFKLNGKPTYANDMNDQ